ncbi:MAG: hypothetical protein ABR975_07175 [Vulcanimicrobiaceae bacterium]
MKLAATISRYLLGIVFLVFGLNGFLQFIPPQPLPPLAMQFFTVIVVSHFTVMVFAFQILVGVLFLVNRYVPLAIVIVAALLVNILTFHITMQPAGLPIPIVVLILWVILALDHRPAFAGLLAARTPD